MPEISNLVKLSKTYVHRLIKKFRKKVVRKARVHKLTPAHMQNRKTRSRSRLLYEQVLSGNKSEFVVTLDETMFGVHKMNGKRKICYVKQGSRVP